MKPDSTFDFIYLEHHDFLRRTARRLCVSSTEAEDLVQDSLLIAYRRLHKLSSQRSTRAWLFSIMFNVHRNDQRRRRRRKRKLEAYHTILYAAPRDVEMLGLAERALKDFLNSLEPEMRAIFILSELEGMTGREVAASLDLNISTTYVRIRALRTTANTVLPVATCSHPRRRTPR